MKFTLKEIINYCTKINKRIDKGDDVNEIADLIIKFENPEFLYRFALYVKCAPINKLADAIIELANEWELTDNVQNERTYPNLPYITQFARDVKGAPVEKLANALTTFGVKGISEYIPFARDVKDAPVDTIADTVIEIGQFDLLEDFAKEVKNAPIDKITDKYLSKLCYPMSDLNPGELADRIIHLGKKVKNAPVEKLTKFILDNGTAEDIYKYALHEKRADVDKLANAVIKKGEVKYIQSFARNVKNAPVESLANGLISKLQRKNKGLLPTGYPSRELYTFARYVKDAPVESLADEIVRMVEDYVDKKETSNLISEYSKNFGFNASTDKEVVDFPINIVAKDIFDFALNVEGAPIEKLAKAIMSTNNERLIVKFAQQIPNAPKQLMMNYVKQFENIKN